MKGTLRIGGAFILGAAIVAGSFALQKSASPIALEGGVITQDKPLKGYIESTDKDNDGIRDWEEELQKNVLKTIAPAPATSTEQSIVEVSDTFTGQFSRAFFEDFVDGKSTKATFQDQESFIQNAVEKIESSTGHRLYTRADINVTEDSDPAIRAYGNTIAEIISRYSIDNENEALILARALEANDASILEDLAPIHAVYTSMITDTLVAPVPLSLVSEHLNLLNTYEAIRTDIAAMQSAFTDPLYTLARMKRYEDDAAGLYYALTNISLALNSRGVVYTKDEPGAFFYLFET